MKGQNITVMAPDPKALKLIARSLFKEMKEHGYEGRHVISVSTELLALVTADLQQQPQPQ
jgi:hypothetical protein